MKWLAVTLGTLVLLALITFGGFTVYSMSYMEGYSLGEATGYDNGYLAGQQTGYDSGQQDGYSLGKEEGYTEGYETGRQDGYSEGITVGYGHSYTLIDPTYKQVIDFLGADKTNENKFDDDTYVCSHFARDVCNNAEDAGLRCALVVINYQDSGHTIIAFDAIDEGLVYYEPQTDERVRPVVGKRFYQCVEPKPGYYYPAPDYDDTIKEILIIW